MNNKIALYYKSHSDFKKIFDILKLNNYEFHCKAPREDKVLSWLLNGVSSDLDEEYILKELNKLKIKNININ